jgi:hypothetical protein
MYFTYYFKTVTSSQEILCSLTGEPCYHVTKSDFGSPSLLLEVFSSEFSWEAPFKMFNGYSLWYWKINSHCCGWCYTFCKTPSQKIMGSEITVVRIVSTCWQKIIFFFCGSHLHKREIVFPCLLPDISRNSWQPESRESRIFHRLYQTQFSNLENVEHSNLPKMWKCTRPWQYMVNSLEIAM